MKNSYKPDFTKEQAERLIDYLKNQPNDENEGWVLTETICLVVGITSAQIRHISATTGLLVSRKYDGGGYKHLSRATAGEFSAFIGDLESRRDALETHIGHSVRAWSEL